MNQPEPAQGQARVPATDRGKLRPWLLGGAWILFQLMLVSSRVGSGSRGEIAMAILGICGGVAFTPLFVTLAVDNEARQVVHRVLGMTFGRRAASLLGLIAFVAVFGLSAALGRHLVQADGLLQQLVGGTWLVLVGLVYAGASLFAYRWLTSRSSAPGG